MFAYTLIFGIFVIIAVVLLSTNNTTKNKKLSKKQINKIDFNVPGISQENQEIANNDIRELMRFSKILDQHRKLGYKDSFDPGIELLSNIIVIIDKIKSSSANDSKLSSDALSALAKYGNIVRKINLLYGEKYFLDAKENPSHWDLKDDPDFFDNIIQVVKDANSYVIRDIQKFNKDNLFDVKTAITSLSNATNREAEEAIDVIFKDTQRKRDSR